MFSYLQKPEILGFSILISLVGNGAGKYYLVDNKYPNMPGFIAPYRGVAYPSNFSNYHPQDAKELFNQRHAALRNATDRTFGALKDRFPILMSAPPYPLQTQVKLVVAACALHNYIRRERPDDLLFRMYEQDAVIQMEESLPPSELEQPSMHIDPQGLEAGFQSDELILASEFRDSIAAEMWDDYISGLASM